MKLSPMVAALVFILLNSIITPLKRYSLSRYYHYCTNTYPPFHCPAKVYDVFFFLCKYIYGAKTNNKKVIICIGKKKDLPLFFHFW